VAVITPEASARIVTPVAVKVALLLPARTLTLAGTLSSSELEPSETVVLAATVCDSVTVQVVVPADINPLSAQASDVTCMLGTREIVTDCTELL
jgi:hypothetical protein